MDLFGYKQWYRKSDGITYDSEIIVIVLVYTLTSRNPINSSRSKFQDNFGTIYTEGSRR